MWQRVVASSLDKSAQRVGARVCSLQLARRTLIGCGASVQAPAPNIQYAYDIRNGSCLLPWMEKLAPCARDLWSLSER